MMSKQGRRSRNDREYNKNTLFVTVKGSKLPDYITGQHLKEHFKQFEDDMVNSMVCREKDTMKSKGYGFITFTSSAVAREAMLTLQGSLLRGKFPLTVKYQRKSSDSFTAVSTSDLSGGTGSCADNSSNTTLYVSVYDSKFPNYVNSGHLREHFSEFQHWIKGAMIVRDSETKETKGYGFVTFTSNAAADLAMKKFRGSKLHDKFRLYINFKETAHSKSPVSSISHSRASSVFDLSSCCTYSDKSGEEDEIGNECTLYVGVYKSKFPNHINSRHLKAHFSDFEAHIKKAMIVRDMKTKESKGFGFVTFSSQAVAENAMKRLRGSMLHDKFKLFINFKEATRSKSPVSTLSHSRALSVFDLSSCCTYSDDGEDEIGNESTLYVSVHKSKFPNHINSRHLEAHFSEFEAHIKKAMIVRDMKTKESKGFGLVTFSCRAVAEKAMKKLRGSKLNGKFSLFISLKGSKAKPISKPSILETEKSLVQLNGTTEQLLYLRYRFYNFPTDESSALKLSLPAELMLHNNTLCLFGTESARKRSSSLIHASKLVQNLQSHDFNGVWDQRFVTQLRDSILEPINTSKQDVLCILTERQEEGPNKISFGVQIFSHSIMTLQETHRKLIVSVYTVFFLSCYYSCHFLNYLQELNPQSKLFQLRPEFTTVPGLTDAFSSFGKDHCSCIEKEAGQGVRIFGLKCEDLHNCWAALKSFVDSQIIVTHDINIEFWQAKLLQSKRSNFLKSLEAEGCKIRIESDTFTTTKQLQAKKVKVVVSGKLKSTKQACEKIKVFCSKCQVETVKVCCNKKYLHMWIKRWKSFINEQEKRCSNLLVEFQHLDQPAASQITVVFTIMGTDPATVAEVKDKLIKHENGSKGKLAKLEVVLTGSNFVVISSNLKECETKIAQTSSSSVVIELDPKSSTVLLLTTSDNAIMLTSAQKELISFIASKAITTQKPTTREVKFKDEVIGSLLSSNECLSKLKRQGDTWSVNVQPTQLSHPEAFILKLSGSGAGIHHVQLAIDSCIKELTASIKHAQLVLGGHYLSIACTDSFKSFCTQLLKELHVKCIYYKPVGDDLLRQVQLRSKSGHFVTLQIAVGQILDERVDAIVIPAQSHDATMTNVEMSFEYYNFLQKNSPKIGDIACIDSGTFPSSKALHLLLPKNCKQVDLLTAYSKVLDYASANQFGSLSFPALGVDDVHRVSTMLCVNTLLQCVDEHCLKTEETTLHTIRVVITQDSSSTFLSCFDKYTFSTLPRSETTQPSSDGAKHLLKVSSPQYEWYWEDDKKQFVQYSPKASNTLSQAKLANVTHKFIDVDGRSYLVDLSTMTQKNVTSGFVRKIMCKEENLTPCNAIDIIDPKADLNCEVQWYYRDDKRTFSAYSQSDSTKIEGMYQKGYSTVGEYLQIHSRMYRFDFDDMKQVNISTKYQRDIKREVVPKKLQEGADSCSTGKAEADTQSCHCIINLRGPSDSLHKAKQMVQDKMKTLAAFKNVPLPASSTPDLKQKLCLIARRHSVSSSIMDEENPSKSKAHMRRFSQVIRIEGAEHLVDKAVTEVQGEIIEFHSQSSSASAPQADAQYPPEWETQTSTSQLFELAKISHEYIRVTSRFRETMPDANIISVKRVQNKWLWGRYNQQKDWMHKKNDGTVNEKELWHGSRKSSAENIYSSEEGFDMRYSSEGLWGQANYFAEKASYSDRYAFTSAGGTKELLLAKVLTGDSFESEQNQSLRMPPEKPKVHQSSSVQLKQLRYDSVNGMTYNCRVYMTYANDKAYPAYLICYLPTPKPKASVPRPPVHVMSGYQSAQPQSQAMQSLFTKLRLKYAGFTQ